MPRVNRKTSQVKVFVHHAACDSENVSYEKLYNTARVNLDMRNVKSCTVCFSSGFRKIMEIYSCSYSLLNM